MLWLPGIPAALASPVLKIPLLLSATYLSAVAQAPPNPPARSEELKKFDGHQDPMLRQSITRRSVKVQNAVYWLNFVCEATTILALQYPTPFGSTVLPTLVLRPSGATRIYVNPVWLTGCAMMHFGSFIRLACYRVLGKNFTWELSVKQGQTLVTSGPYAVVRHPSYVGALTIYTGVILVMFGPGSWYAECIGWDTWVSRLFTGVCTAWATVVPMMLMRRVVAEDEVLRKEFGKEWEAYAKKVPYRLFPFIY